MDNARPYQARNFWNFQNKFIFPDSGIAKPTTPVLDDNGYWKEFKAIFGGVLGFWGGVGGLGTIFLIIVISQRYCCVDEDEKDEGESWLYLCLFQPIPKIKKKWFLLIIYIWCNLTNFASIVLLKQYPLRKLGSKPRSTSSLFFHFQPTANQTGHGTSYPTMCCVSFYSKKMKENLK